MSLTQVIRDNFLQIISSNGTEVLNEKTNKSFVGLVTSGDFMSSFTEGDQDTELSLQITMLEEEAPKTGDILLIHNKRYITQTVQSRVNGPITKVTVFETRKKK